MLEFWSANATGVYSGIAQGNDSVLNDTTNRGLQMTDENGIAKFTAYYPGHYWGRTNHYHIASHVNGT